LKALLLVLEDIEDIVVIIWIISSLNASLVHRFSVSLCVVSLLSKICWLTA
jgi:hypothetical protein